MTTAEPQVEQYPAAVPLDPDETKQLGRLRRWGTAGALLMMIGSTSSYGAASPIPNPFDGIRILGLMSRISSGALAVSYSGMGLLVMCWLLIGRLARPGRVRRLSRSQLSHTLAMWTVPFLVTPPIFSRDVYSYLAVGSMSVHGFNPYDAGPYDTLGDSDVFSHQVDARWQHTPTPYGPAYVMISKAVVAITGQHLVLAVLVQRLVELVGIAAIIWALPRLARRCGIDPVAALWLGALNPLVLFHLIAGGHNEALMLGAMLAGLVIALDRSWVVGVAIITLAVAIKATAAMALPFLVIALALRRSTAWRDLLRRAIAVAAVGLVVFAAISWAAGDGFGWLAGLGAPGMVRSFLSVSTSLGIGAGQIGRVLGLGDHSDAAISVMQPLGTVAGALLAVGVMWLTWRRRLEPVAGLGLAFGAFVLLGPVIQPWYLLWAVLPLAASTANSRFRTGAVWFTAAYSLLIMPNGGTIPPFTIIAAVTIAAIVAAIAAFLLWRHGLPVADPGNAAPARSWPGSDKPYPRITGANREHGKSSEEHR
ncbi:MAG: polyprenol phosphomannose-dependent alpha 1,6 mannosyltransferase MptB [Actinomycetota bacterium]|nr:polyprenol phosphomannose-dependent alpha 1,6 mannosyltransferase MptB [Actinomycetota bacterium]